MKYTQADERRLHQITPAKGFSFEPYRTAWRRDYSRLIHSPSFRRLQGKTQLFPGQESDFFRSRLTHSLEVGQIAKSIAIKLNYDLSTQRKRYRIEPDIVEFAALAHDLGHPPFGHLGEEILDEKMKDFGGFEGNAQSLRLLTRIEKKTSSPTSKFRIYKLGKDNRIGLNLTSRSLASILKYNVAIPIKYDQREELLLNRKVKKLAPIKGYYKSEENIVQFVKDNVTGIVNYNEEFKTIECQIMDLADDIAYSTYDLEDSFKAGFISPLDLISADPEIIYAITESVNRSLESTLSVSDVKDIIITIFNEIVESPIEIKRGTNLSKAQIEKLVPTILKVGYTDSKKIAVDGYERTNFTSQLVGKFIRNVEFLKIDGSIPALSTVQFKKSVKYQVEVLKKFTFYYQILSPKLKIAEYRGKKIVEEIFDILSDTKGGYQLMPSDYQRIFKAFPPNDKLNQMRTICDFIAGMTDRYAIEFWGRLKSEFPQTIFKPH